MVMVVTGAEPTPWPFDRGLVAPEWRWAWDNVEVATIIWEGGGDIYNYATRSFGTVTGGVWTSGPNGIALSDHGSG